MKQTLHQLFNYAPGVRCFAVIGALCASVLLAPPAAVAFGVGFSSGDLRGEPSKYRRHVLCNEAWRKSPAASQQQCKLRSVHWDSYRNDLSYGYGDVFGEAAHMAISKCWIHVECLGAYWWQTGRTNGKVLFGDVTKLARCKHDPKTLEPGCEPVTEEQLRAWKLFDRSTHPKYAD
ncbi:MAG: hypothetical protein OXE94_07115 [Aestuariivita sp.]|nr:hypothetical protein [Aestuariivita sp.]MCY4202790.1 hypothetical protein [Aestuariivita sp.]MCY4289993.1 hypothetical protein [Aestuariivita sp.]MCY4345666.1 hypothetical protein [Aestuariivita sp.]